MDSGFRSPNIMRREISKETIAAHSVRKSRRAKSTEPTSPEFLEVSGDNDTGLHVHCAENNREMPNTKLHESMSKTELINSYRLLMSEKLRLERFLSILSKNNEMARNRLESDLLDAMMCIEDLKQALELRMARRRKIDPQEAEERRYLIRQNKKLLNQLYESAKKIERLELTKVEMKEQLELLDFQILEVENQKALMEEELRKLAPSSCSAVQTEESTSALSDYVDELRKQVSTIQMELFTYKAEAATAVVKQQHLDNLVRELRRDNVDLREQLTKMDDVENSLAESDKPLLCGTRALQSQLEIQLERVRDLEAKLQASRDYSTNLESRLKASMDGTFNSTECEGVTPTDSEQVSMHKTVEYSSGTGLRVPRVDDLLLQETIRTFHSLIAERDQELSQLRAFIRQNQMEPVSDDVLALCSPHCSASATQTDLCMEDCEKFAAVMDNLSGGGLLLSPDQRTLLGSELRETINLLEGTGACGTSQENIGVYAYECSSVPQILSVINGIRKHVQEITVTTQTSQPVCLSTIKVASGLHADEVSEAERTGRLQPTVLSEQNDQDRTGPQYLAATHQNPDKGSHKDTQSQPTLPLDRSTSAPAANSSAADKPHSSTDRTPKYYDTQLQQLKETSELELTRSSLIVLERRCHELERRVSEATEELARVHAESRATEASLSAARRTEAALRRRLLVAMDVQGSGTATSRHSVGASFYSASETKNPVELEAALIKSEAINTSLTETAHLDRNRLHDQAILIGQLEAERRVLLDRISVLQASEAAAQRGVVRLQALYEDMLREYSESCSQETTWRCRGRSRSSYGNKVDRDSSDARGLSIQHVRQRNATSKVQDEITALQKGNHSLKETGRIEEENKLMNTAHPVGRCLTPACIQVRHLLKAFQDRFNDVVCQLADAQKYLDMQQSGMRASNPLEDDCVCVSLVKSVRQQFDILCNTLKSQSLSDNGGNNLLQRLTSCSNSLGRLEKWLQTYLLRTDAELMQLRKGILGLQLSGGDGEQSFETTCVDRDSEQPKEHEILQLRKHIRKLEVDLELAESQHMSRIMTQPIHQST